MADGGRTPLTPPQVQALSMAVADAVTEALQRLLEQQAAASPAAWFRK